jgi:hypothetical protein
MSRRDALMSDDDNIEIRLGPVLFKAKPPDCVLMLGPVVYHVKRRVLLSVGDNMLASVFSHDNDMEPSNVDEDGASIIHVRPGAPALESRDSCIADYWRDC